MISNANEGNDLLFGMVSVQLGLLNQQQLMDVVTSWVDSEAQQISLHPIRDEILNRGWISEPQALAIDQVVETQLIVNGGDHSLCIDKLPTGDSLMRLFEDIEDQPKRNAVTDLVGVSTDDSDCLLAESSGSRFRVKQEYAHGGLGEILIADDYELGREVAIKRIRGASRQNEEAQARFLLEAEVTGMLEHPGVVPVYGRGTTVDGDPYYAMRFIQGDSLQETVTKLHSGEVPFDPNGIGFRKLIRRLIEMCETIDYAHSEGVIHRDLKPANVILGPYGETLVVDWGLAKVVGKPDVVPREQAGRLSGSTNAYFDTMEGSTIGTPGYMSPEQSRGHMADLDGRSDVYGLGAILYTVLTGVPSVSRKDADWVEQIQEGRFASPRSINPLTPRPLESICRKAMEIDADKRYQAPNELAEDLEKWLADDLPVAHGDHEAFEERLGRSFRRNRSRYLASIAVLVFFGLGSVIMATTLRGKNKELGSALAASQKMSADLERKNSDLDEALSQASRLGNTLMDTVDEVVAHVPRQVNRRVALSELVVDGYAELYALAPENEEIAMGYANSLHYRARLLRRVSSLDLSRDCFDKSLALFEQMVQNPNVSDEVRGNMVNVLVQRAQLGFKEGELQDARTALGSAEAQLALTKDSWTKQLSSANIVFAIAEYYEFNGDFAEARLRFKDASDRFRRLVKGEKLATYSQYLIQALTKQASQEYELGHAAALDTINEAIQFADDVIEVQTAYQRENQYRRIEAYLIRSRINFRNGWLPATEDDINVAKSESQKLFGEFPKYHHFKLQYARILRMEARVARSQDQTQESLNLLSEAMTIIRTKENNFIWESELVRTARLQARIFLVDGKTDMAEESLKLAISKQEGIYAAYSVPTEATVLQELKDLLSKVEATRSNDE